MYSMANGLSADKREAVNKVGFERRACAYLGDLIDAGLQTGESPPEPRENDKQGMRSRTSATSSDFLVTLYLKMSIRPASRGLAEALGSSSARRVRPVPQRSSLPVAGPSIPRRHASKDAKPNNVVTKERFNFNTSLNFTDELDPDVSFHPPSSAERRLSS